MQEKTMRKQLLAVALAATATTGLAATAATSASAVPPRAHAARVCSAPTSPTVAACDALKLVDDHGTPVSPSGRTVTPAAISGKTPADIQAAYKLTGLSSGGRTVAIVDACGYTKAEQDLGVYRSQFGLSACTTANGCLRIMNQTGGTSLPRYDNGWAQEQALDLDAVSAACPSCRIVAAPSGQTSAMTSCSGRAIADVSAVADPNTGLAVYAPSTKSTSGWAQYGGTSLSSPIVASVYALSGNTAGYANTLPYANTGGLFDVTSGSNGSCTRGASPSMRR